MLEFVRSISTHTVFANPFYEFLAASPTGFTIKWCVCLGDSALLSCGLRPLCAIAKRTIENPNGKEHGVSEATLDGQPMLLADGIAHIPLLNDGALHRVMIRL